MASYTHKVMVRAVGLHQGGKLGEAEGLYRSVLAQEPNNPEALHLLGVLLHQLGRSGEGLELVRRAIGIRPRSPEYLVNAAEIARALGRQEEALGLFQRAAQLNGNIPELHNNLATLQSALGQWDAAEASLARALQLRPNFSEAFVNLGNLLLKRARTGEAVAAYQRALQVNPNNAAGLASLGNVLERLGRTDEAIAALRRAVELEPRLSKAHSNLANALQARGRLEEAYGEYATALQLDPGNAGARGSMLLAFNRDPQRSAEEIFEAHVAFGRVHEAGLAAARRPHENSREADRPLRIGYVSPDFRSHSVAAFIEPVLARHDKSRFHVTAYARVFREDATTERLRSYTDAWRDVRALADEELAELVRRDRIDVLVDLAGHTNDNALLAFARKPAPVQVTWLGYPNTTGLTSMDYRITDALADPPGQTEHLHTEKLLRLPVSAWCFRPPGDAPAVAARDPARPITFGSFNNFMKLNEELLGLWGRILQAVPGSRLLIKAHALGNAETQGRCRSWLSRFAVEAERVELLAWDPSPAGHLATYNRVDVALDTFPYHGTTTTCEALYMGVPVVTLAGRTHVSRVGVSLLTNAGVGELVASSAEEYVARAASVAQDRERLREYHATLRQKLVASPLCDGEGFTRQMESAYRQAWQAYCLSGVG